MAGNEHHGPQDHGASGHGASGHEASGHEASGHEASGHEASGREAQQASRTPNLSFGEHAVRSTGHPADGSASSGVVQIRRGPGAWWRHCGLSPDRVMRAFDDAAFDRIEAAIGAAEVHHRGEIRFAIESGLGWRALRQGLSPRARALQIFGEHRIWDTEENTGILIYLLTADHAVEIIADRLVHRALPSSVWKQACARVSEAAAPGGEPVEGVLAAIALLTQALTTALPAHPGRANDNELDNRPLRL